jgi:adenylate cyclase class 2
MQKLMQTEIEAKFLDIDPKAMREILANLRAVLIHPEVLMKRKVFDHPTNKQGDWFRVRDEGNKITMSYKKIVDRTVYGTKEINIEVSDFDNACDILAAAQLVLRSYQETRRERWFLDDVEVTIDTWPWIPTFVELESSSEESLKLVAKKLGLEWSKALYGSVEPAYQAYYDVTEKEIDSWPEITFSPVPDWLLKRKK